MVTDRLADLLFTPSEDADANLEREGVPPQKIHRVGNVMIDSLVRLLPVAAKVPRNGFPHRYALVTLHRPSNVDDNERLKNILQSLVDISERLGCDFSRAPAHATANCGIRAGSRKGAFIRAFAVHRIPRSAEPRCGRHHRLGRHSRGDYLTWRAVPDVTEQYGAAGDGQHRHERDSWTDREKLRAELSKVVSGNAKKGTVPPLWDGHAGERIAATLGSICCKKCSASGRTSGSHLVLTHPCYADAEAV